MGSPPWDPEHPLLTRTYASQPLLAPPWGASSVSLELLPPNPLSWPRCMEFTVWLMDQQGRAAGIFLLCSAQQAQPLPSSALWLGSHGTGEEPGALARRPAGSEGPCQVSSPALFAHPIRHGRNPLPCLGGSVLGRIKWGTPCTSMGNRTQGEQPLCGVPGEWARWEAARTALHFVCLCRLTGLKTAACREGKRMGQGQLSVCP